MAGTLTISGNKPGLLTGSQTVGPQTVTGTATVGQVADVTLGSGDNTIAVPGGATAVYVALPASNTATLKIRTNLNSSDGGMQVGPTGFVVFSFPGTTTSLIVNASTGTGAIEATFI